MIIPQKRFIFTSLAFVLLLICVIFSNIKLFSYVTASNSLGTHLGNCVGLHKPHVLFNQEITYEGNTKLEFGKTVRSDNWKDQFTFESEMFEKMFAPTGKKAELTQEQYQFCDYYWGFSKKKTPEEILDIYKKCHEYAFEFVKCNCGRK